jgi:hypothetical protein
MADTTQEQIVRDASDIEQRKVALMDSAKAQIDATNAAALNGQYLTPDYQVAGMSPDQLNALDLGRQGIGAYLPYMQNATNQYQMAGNNVQQGVNTLLGADTRNQFGAAQAAMNRAATPIANMGQSAQLATQGVGLIGQGSADVDTAQADLRKYAQADLAASQGYLNNSVAAMNKAMPDYAAATGMVNQGISQSDLAARQAQQAATQPGFAQGIGALFKGADQGQAATQQAGFGAGITNALQAAEAAKLAAAQPGFNQATSTLQQGIGALGGGAQAYDPASAQRFMNPYQQQVIDESTRQINRQADIQRQNLQAQAVRAGAFGGSREGVQRAELERATAEQRNAAIVGALSSGYNTAQQQAMSTFEQQQQRQLAQAQGYQGAAGTQASIAAQQAGLGQSAAQQLQQAAQLQASTAGQQAGLGLQAAGLTQQAGQGAISAAGTQGQLGLSAAQQQAAAGQANLQGASQLAGMQTQGAQLGQSAAQYMGNVGQTLGQQQLQQAQLGQAAANSAGQLGVQQAGLSGLYSNIAGQQANIYNQQATAGMNMAQGIGSLAQQQFGIGQNIAQGLGSLGAQQGNLATQGAALGQAAQGMGQQDTNFLFNLGSTQQKQLQNELDATRQNELQQNMQPYQQLGFLSDIYKGAPSSSMSTMQQSQATPSPFTQGAGLVIGGVSAAAAAGRSGII